MLDGLVQFAGTALKSGKTVIVVITAQLRAELDARMRAQGINIDLAIREEKYLLMDVLEMLSAVMTDGWPDEARFWNTAMSLLARVASASPEDDPRLAACGEGAAFLVKHGRMDAAIRLESLWDEFARTCNVDIFCPYVMAHPAHDHDADIVQRISAVHSAVHGHVASAFRRTRESALKPDTAYDWCQWRNGSQGLRDRARSSLHNAPDSRQ